MTRFCQKVDKVVVKAIDQMVNIYRIFVEFSLTINDPLPVLLGNKKDLIMKNCDNLF